MGGNITYCMRNRNGETAQFSIRMPIELKEQIEEIANKMDIDLSTWVRHACREKLENYHKMQETQQKYNESLIADAVEKYLESRADQNLPGPRIEKKIPVRQ